MSGQDFVEATTQQKICLVGVACHFQIDRDRRCRDGSEIP